MTRKVPTPPLLLVRRKRRPGGGNGESREVPIMSRLAEENLRVNQSAIGVGSEGCRTFVASVSD